MVNNMKFIRVPLLSWLPGSLQPIFISNIRNHITLMVIFVPLLTQSFYFTNYVRVLPGKLVLF